MQPFRKRTCSLPNTINQVTVGYNRIFNHILSFGTGSCEAANIGIPGADLGAKCDPITGYPASLNQSNKDCISCGMTSFLMSNYFAIGDRGYAPYQGGTNVYSVSDTLDLIRGKHNIRFGGYIPRESDEREKQRVSGRVCRRKCGADRG